MQDTVETKETVTLKLLQRGKQDQDFATLLEELKKSNSGVSHTVYLFNDDDDDDDVLM